MVPRPCVVVKNKAISVVEISTEERGVPAPGWTFRLGLQCWEEESLRRARKPAGIASEGGRGCSTPAILQEGPRCWLMQELTRGSNPGTGLGGARDVWEELC